jgi:23S rRNA pseudouridine2604 synthase
MQEADCSRAEAERLIESGRVRVDGAVQQAVPTRVRPEQAVTIDGSQPAKGVAPATVVMHKPAGVTMEALLKLIVESNHLPNDRSGLTLLARHTKGLECVTPLEPAASGLVVWTQVPGIARKLVEEGSQIEHEVMVDVEGPVSASQLAELNRSLVVDGRAMLPARVSISQSQPDLTRLRMAMKGYWQGQVLQLCDAAGLRLLAIRRQRIGRMPLRDLPAGQWRILLGYERF